MILTLLSLSINVPQITIYLHLYCFLSFSFLASADIFHDIRSAQTMVQDMPTSTHSFLLLRP